MDYKRHCVIDAERNYKTFVLAFLEPDETGAEELVIQYYTLGDGESLIDTAPPTFRSRAGAVGFIRPHWNGTAWIEGATQEEIATWEAGHPVPEPAPPDPLAVLQGQNKLLEAQVAALNDQSEFQEELIVELANVVYA